MKPTQPHWNRLAAGARLAPSPAGAPAPIGFATRVVARAFAAQTASPTSLYELFSWRAVAAAVILALGSIAFNFHAVASTDEDVLVVNDPVAEVLSLT